MNATDRARAVTYAAEHGVTAAANEFGVTRQSVYNWIKASIDVEKTPEQQARDKLYQEQLRSNIRTRLLEKVDNLLDRFDQPHIDYRGKDTVQVEWPTATSADVRNYATTIGILIDKYRLEVGEATSRHEGSDDIDRSIAQLVAELERRGQTPVT